MKPYKDRLKLPLNSIDCDDIQFYTRTQKTHVATNYNRVVIGGRGPYIEFELEMLDSKNCFIPKEQEYRIDNDVVYYVELRTNDKDNVKIYIQKRCVSYADYIIGKAYISPFDLTSDKYETLIE